LDRMEQKIMQKEAEAEAFAEMADVYYSGYSENSGKSGILSDARIDSELQRLLTEMNDLEEQKHK
ncbi:MAG: hypothetical protein K2H82_00340, partial [Oscillospiraceae bacterium]|nr:hypothetical protein [Oscillospiraceae bacterium]